MSNQNKRPKYNIEFRQDAAKLGISDYLAFYNVKRIQTRL